jgi:O-acetylserine/cysteine efflux transporter
MIRKLKEIEGMQVTAWISVFAAPQLFLMAAIFEDGQIRGLSKVLSADFMRRL